MCASGNVCHRLLSNMVHIEPCGNMTFVERKLDIREGIYRAKNNNTTS